MFHKRLLSEFNENKKYVAGIVLTQWVSLIANLILTGLTVWYLTGFTEENAAGRNHVGYLAAFAAVLIMRALMMTLESRMSYRASVCVKRTLRTKVYDKLMQLGADYRKEISTSEAVQISTEGVEQLEIYFGKYVPQFFYSLLAPLTLFVVVSPMSLKVAVVLLICVPLIPGAIMGVQKFAKKMLNKYWGTYTELGDTFLEGLQGLTTLKVYQADESYAKKMDEDSEKFRKVTMRVLIMQLNSISIMDLVAYGGAALGIVLSILEYRSGRLGLAQCLFIILVSAEFFLPMRRLGSFFHIAMNGNAAADKIFKLLDAEEKTEGTQAPVSQAQSAVVFDDVTFGYQKEKDVLRQVSFAIERNCFTAIVGVSGCGKSTIASLIMGEQSGYDGEIVIGDKASSQMKRDSVYQSITRVRHDSYLFQGTIEDNLRMGKPDATAAQLEQALKMVDLYETVQEKGGLSMEVTEKAANLSGGQKQRLALARAVLHDSDIYIFDEATSNVDVESENKIMEVIIQLAKVKTIVLISHRLANVVSADQILFMEIGRIAEQGRHEELLAKDGAYAGLYNRQKVLERYGKEVA